MTVLATYRDATGELRARQSAAISAERRVLGATDTVRVVAARASRIALGMCLALAAMCGFARATLLADTGIPHAAYAFGLGWPLAVAIALTVYTGTWLVGAQSVRRALVPISDPLLQTERLTRDPPSHRWRARAARLELASVFAPLAGAALCTPLALHALYFLLESRGWFDYPMFDEWVAVSALIVGHAHLALVVHAAFHARKLASTPTESLPEVMKAKGWSALAIAVLTACVPGLLIFVVPPALTLVTGTLFIPALYAGLHRALLRERRRLDAARAPDPGQA